MGEKENFSKIDDDKTFYRKMVMELVDLSKVNAKQISENNKAIQEQTLGMQTLTVAVNELKNSIQIKPCIAEKTEEALNKGWEGAIVKSYQYIIGGLFGLIAGILGAIGLYKGGP